MFKTRFYLYLLVTITCLKSIGLYAGEFSEFTIKKPDRYYNKPLFSYTYLLRPENKKYTFKEVRKLDSNHFFKVNEIGDSLLGPVNGFIWGKVSIFNSSQKDHSLVIVPGSNVDILQYEIFVNSDTTPRASGVTGMSIDPENRPALIGNTGLPFTFKANTKYVLIYKLKSFYLMEAAVSLKSNMVYEEEYTGEVLFWMGLVGLILTLCFYNFYRYLSSKNFDYLWYSIFCLSTILNFVCFIESAQTVLYELIGGIHSYLHLFASFASTAGMVFTSEFVNMKKHTKKLYIFIWFINILIFLSSLVSMLIENQFSGMFKVLMVLSPINIFVMMGTITYIIIKYNKKEYIGVLVAFLSLLVTVTLGYAIASASSGTTRITNMFFGVGAIIEVVIMSYTLSRAINNYKLELIEKLNKHEEDLMDEVNIKSREIIETNNKLHHSESMKGLGIVAAALAHEINNPLSIIQGNITRLKRGINQEFEHSAIAVSGDIALMNSSVKEIADIIKSIYFFSKEDNNLITMESILLNDIFEKILLELKSHHYLKYMYFDYSSVPKDVLIEGSPYEIKNAFLKIIYNSVEAMADEDIQIIRIIYDQNDDNHIFNVFDTGPGISEENKVKVFEPMFTTKAEYGHSGLGLSISQKIINLCLGDIKCIKLEGDSSYNIQIVLPKRGYDV